MDIKFDTIKKLNAADTVKENMGVYQQYLVQSKLPHPIDGLKDVTRRAIYAMIEAMN
jgi:DNA gyrase/topoisomerase IV subunit A